MRLILLLLVLALAPGAALAQRIDERPRIAVVSAFAPELTLLGQSTQNRREHRVHGVTFITGELEGKPVVLFLSGVSMVNAAMTTQMALDRFNIRAIVFSGIAGGVDPSLGIGDVVVAEQWSQYMESALARERDGQFIAQAVPPFVNHGMIFPRPVAVLNPQGMREERFWFPVDPAMLAVARRVAADASLTRCSRAPSGQVCLQHAPRVVVGGNGVSGPAFVDNAAFRQWAFTAFQARVLDMESAAVAHVAYVNRTPFIAFRSLSDLAGEDAEGNQISTFFQLASDNSASVVRAFVRALPE